MPVSPPAWPDGCEPLERVIEANPAQAPERVEVGAVVEHGKWNVDTVLSFIEAVGTDNTISGSDLRQKDNPFPINSYERSSANSRRAAEIQPFSSWKRSCTVFIRSIRKSVSSSTRAGSARLSQCMRAPLRHGPQPGRGPSADGSWRRCPQRRRVLRHRHHEHVMGRAPVSVYAKGTSSTDPWRPPSPRSLITTASLEPLTAALKDPVRTRSRSSAPRDRSRSTGRRTRTRATRPSDRFVQHLGAATQGMTSSSGN
jgi:hypothetical protein